MSIALEAALLDVQAAGGRSAADIQRSLATGRCAACDLPVATGFKRRRTCLCEECAKTLAWCSRCQRPKDRSAFPRDRTSRNGLNGECRSCRRQRQPRARAAVPRCARKGCPRAAAAGKRNYHKLCAICLDTHAWCSACKRARLRREFAREVRLHKRHAGVCLACDRTERPATGAAAEKSAAARARYLAIRDYAQAHPTAEKAEIVQALGVSLHQIREAMVALGFRIGHGPKKAAALERYKAVVGLSLAEIMEREGLSYTAATTLRSKARKALAHTEGTGS